MKYKIQHYPNIVLETDQNSKCYRLKTIDYTLCATLGRQRMKIKKFNITVFLMVTIIVGVLLFPSLFAAFAEDEGTLRSDDTFLNFFARLFYILRFPTHTLLWPIISLGGPLTFFAGLFVNCMFYGLVAERITSLFRKNKVKSSDTIDEKSST